MATEALKILTKEEPAKLEQSAKTMLLYSAFNETPFRTIRLKGKREDCPSCSWPPKIDKHSLGKGKWNYKEFCGLTTSHRLAQEQRISAKDYLPNYRAMYLKETQQNLIDVRNEVEFEICHLPQAKNIPLSDIQRDASILRPHLESIHSAKNDSPPPNGQLFFVCRYGNDSQEAVRAAGKYLEGVTDIGKVELLDIKGGLKAWKNEVDPQFPEY